MPNPFDIAGLDAELEALLDLDDVSRRARLAEIAAQDPARAAVLQRLLAAAISDTDPTREFRRGMAAVGREPDQAPSIPGYRITGLIGRGGMAVVYAAERVISGVAQQVAIKLLEGVGDAQSRERFVTEQRILARLRHPHIAGLLDVGVIGDQAWMALEHVAGQRIDERLLPRVVDVPAIVTALIAVCDALALAHAHFIIHRDIKPANVLIDQNGQVKLIDFGIAKVLADSTLVVDATTTGVMPLTLRYASPEQLLNRPVGVTSDVYQVGLLAAQLLTGRLPFADQEGALISMRTQPEHTPLLPSRCVQDPALRRALVGDLDSIVQRCLCFEPGARYPTISALAEDLRRHQTHQPVLARRQTRGYLLRRFIYRHRLGVAICTLLGLLIALGSVSALVFSARAQTHAQRVERILDSVTTLFARANPYADDAESVTVAEAVAATGQKFLREEDADPEFQVLMLERLAELSTASARFDDAVQLLQRARALGDQHALDLGLRDRIRASLADALFERGDYDAVDQLIAAADLVRHDESGLRLRYVAAKVATERGELDSAEQRYQALLTELPESSLSAPLQSLIVVSHGVLLRRLGRADEAIAAYRRGEALLDPNDVTQQEDRTAIRLNIAIAYGAAGRSRESDAAFSDLLNDLESQLGREHNAVWSLARNYATLLNRTQRFASAYVLLNRYPQALSDTLGNELRRASFLEAYAGAAFNNGDNALAMQSILRAIELQRRVIGARAPALAGAVDWAAWMLFEFGDLERAAAMAEIAGTLRGAPSNRVGSMLRLVAEINSGAVDEPTARAWSNQIAGSCEQREYEVLRQILVLHETPVPAALPEACVGAPVARLVRLGAAAWPEQDGAFPRENLRSPGVGRWLATLAGQSLSPVEFDREAVDSMIDALRQPAAP